jgi:NAD(P)-dependent dehydrogenase (short-subunit alcohol dehydrogenase family)
MAATANTRRILLTGVSRGLGRALLDEFHRAGHVVLASARSQRVMDDLARQFPPPHRFQAVDVADAQAVDAWIAGLLAAGPAPDLVLNNAAQINANAPLWAVPPGEFSRIVDVNLKGTYHVLRAVLPAMLERRQGVIVNFSSGWGRSTSPEVAPYCATKWAVEGLTRALAQELPRPLAAVALDPGIIHTDMLASCFQGAASAYPSPRQWAARAAPFLLSLGPGHNGQPLRVPE